MPRGKSAAQVSRVRMELAECTHRLHVAERDLRYSYPLVATLLRAARQLVADAGVELYQPRSPTKKTPG